MPSILQAIRDVTRRDHQMAGVLELTEDQPGSTSNKVILSGAGQVIGLKLDRAGIPRCDQLGCRMTTAPNHFFFPLFRTDLSGITQMCDYIVFCQGKEGLYVLLCELKSSRGQPVPQFQNTRLLVEYLLNMSRHHGNVYEKSDVFYRGITFTKDGVYPKGNLRQIKCQYQSYNTDLKIARYRDGREYDLTHFCV